MRLVLVHIDNLARANPSIYEEEAAFLIPGGERSVIMAPFAALDDLLPVLREALEGLPEQRCGGCGEPLAVLPPA